MIVGGCWLLCWLPPPERSQWGSKQVAAKELTPKFESPGDFHENMREWLKVMEEIKPVILLLLHRKKGTKSVPILQCVLSLFSGAPLGGWKRWFPIVYITQRPHYYYYTPDTFSTQTNMGEIRNS